MEVLKKEDFVLIKNKILEDKFYKIYVENNTCPFILYKSFNKTLQFQTCFPVVAKHFVLCKTASYSKKPENYVVNKIFLYNLFITSLVINWYQVLYVAIVLLAVDIIVVVLGFIFRVSYFSFNAFTLHNFDLVLHFEYHFFL